MRALVEGLTKFPRLFVPSALKMDYPYAFLVPSQSTRDPSELVQSNLGVVFLRTRTRILVVSASSELTHVCMCLRVLCVAHTCALIAEALSDHCYATSPWLSRCPWTYAWANCFTQWGISDSFQDFLVPMGSG